MPDIKIDKRSKAYRDSKQAQTNDLIPDTGQDVIVAELPDMTSRITNAMTSGNMNQVQALMIEDLGKTQYKELTTQYMSQTILEPEVSNKIVVPTLREIRGKIAIKPYISGEEKMGLENPNQPGGAMALFPGTFQTCVIGCANNNGYKTYFTGLDENAMEVQTLPEAQKIAKITTIRQVVAYLENKVANNFKVRVGSCMKGFGTDEDKFWENVTTFYSSGPDKFDAKGNRRPTYWDGLELKLDNDGLQLDKSDPKHLIFYYAICAGGLSLVAPSLQSAMDHQGAYNFYLDQPEETADIKTEFKKLRNQAGGFLESMRLNDENRLFLMSKMVAVQGSSMYHRGGPNYTPVNQMYDDQCRYIDGEAGDNKQIAVKKFLEFYNTPIDILTRRAVIKDASELHLIEPKGDGRLYYRNEPLGKTIEDMVEYLNNPLNDRVWIELRDKIEQEWTT